MLEVINLLQTTYLDPGTVSVRVAFVLRSTEVLPAFSDLFPPPTYRPPAFEQHKSRDRKDPGIRIQGTSDCYRISHVRICFHHLITDSPGLEGRAGGYREDIGKVSVGYR